MFPNFDPALLESADFKEDSVREVLIAPMLARLGYHPSGESRAIRSKGLSHPFIRAGTRNHPVTLIPDYTLIHKDKVVMILDAKSPSEDVLAAAHVQQAYSYAIHPDIRTDHFALCNGKRLAVFHIQQTEPLLVIEFAEYESKWTDIEKHLGVRYLLEPALRRFQPDFGFALKRMGMSESTLMSFIGVRLGMFAKLDGQLMTASANTELADATYAASFDFPHTMLAPIVAGLPESLRDQFLYALSRQPFQAGGDLVIEIDITTKLGPEIAGEKETFVPLQIIEVMGSRFNPSPVAGDGSDIPPGIFRLRNAFEIR